MSVRARDRIRVVEHLRWQAESCEQLGSPFYAVLLRHLADDAARDGVVGRLLNDQRGDLDALAPALRLLGGVHRLVLSGRASALARCYPSVGGSGDADAAVAPFLALVAEQEDTIREALQRAPQTNEVGRSAALVGALCHLVQVCPLPLRLVELGASGGLNLRCERFKIGTEDGRWYGPTGSPVFLERAWRGQVPPMARPLIVVERAGCDPYAVDPTTDDGALTLTSYVWPDQLDRLARLRGAMAVAHEVPVTLEPVGAAEHLGRLTLHSGSWLVVWHSVMWQYLSAEERQATLDRLDQIGAAATASSPVAHVAFEPRVDLVGPTFAVTVQTWPDVGVGPGPRVLGYAPPHGVPVDWV